VSMWAVAVMASPNSTSLKPPCALPKEFLRDAAQDSA
jgi:hypothetical protein